MGRRHDRSSESLARRGELADGAPKAVEPLSDVLRAVRLTGATFFLVDAAPPWLAELPEAGAFGPVILPGAQQIVSYHIIRKGPCWGGLIDAAPVRLETGDILLIPHGDAYALSSPSGMRAADPTGLAVSFFRLMSAGQLPLVLTEGGDGPERIQVVCGFLGCDVRPFNPVLEALPRLIHLRRSPGPEGERLSHLIEFALAESRERRSGGQCVLLRLSELMFVEVVRRYLEALTAEHTGWLAGLRDPLVGRALGLLHRRPARPWTLETLAGEAGASRSTLADRFAHFVGQPPMQYLARWRMQMAASRLAEGGAKVAAIASEVGYESEAAFSRAFKKIVGASPASWRMQLAGAGRNSSPRRTAARERATGGGPDAGAARARRGDRRGVPAGGARTDGTISVIPKTRG